MVALVVVLDKIVGVFGDTGADVDIFGLSFIETESLVRLSTSSLPLVGKRTYGLGTRTFIVVAVQMKFNLDLQEEAKKTKRN